MSGKQQKITRADIEARFRALAGDVEVKKAEQADKAKAAAIGGALLLLVIVFLLGNRRGRRRTTVVEVRRF